MKTGCFGILLALASVLPAWAQVAVPPSFNYQGVLRDGIGGVLAEQTPTVHFKLYNVNSGGEALWTGSQKVLLDANGLFNVVLSDEMAGTLGGVTLGGVIASNQILFMGITVNENTEISPRQQLLSVPFALRAGDVNRASSGFTVSGGSLTANSGAHVLGLLDASSIRIGTNTLTVADAHANLKLTGNLDITDQLHVMQNARVDGAAALKGNVTVDGTTTLNGNTTVSNLTVAGPVSVFTRSTVDSGGYQKLTSGNLTLMTNASSDGIMMISFSYYFDASKTGDSDHNSVRYRVECSGGSSAARNIETGYQILATDSTAFERVDITSIPVLKGETVKLVQLAWILATSESTVYVKHYFVPFGVSQTH